MKFVFALLFNLLLAVSAIAADFTELADELRAAMAQRDFPTAKAKLEEVKAAATTDTEKVVAERLDLLHGYLFDFWKAVHTGGRKLQGADELVIGEKRTAVVEYDEEAGKLVLRVAGQNKRYTLRDMPPKVALTLAQQVMKADAPANEVFFGTFLAMDARGDRKLARAAWEKAAKAGSDVKLLLPELDVPLPASATVELPILTPQTAALLRPQFWQLAVPGEKGWTREEVTKFAAQNEQGRLEITIPAEPAGEKWIVFGRKLGTAFGVRMYLTGMPKGQKLVLLDAKEVGEAATMELPAGTVMIEIARQRGELVCRINGVESKLTIRDDKAAKVANTLGFSAPEGSTVTIAGLEVK